MSKINDGGPAFPLSKDMVLDPVTNLSGEDVSSGMSLRDYFAAQAMPAVIMATSQNMHQPLKRDGERTVVPAIARDAYAIADAMLSARSDQGGGNG